MSTHATGASPGTARPAAKRAPVPNPDSIIARNELFVPVLQELLGEAGGGWFTFRSQSVGLSLLDVASGCFLCIPPKGGLSHGMDGFSRLREGDLVADMDRQERLPINGALDAYAPTVVRLLAGIPVKQDITELHIAVGCDCEKGELIAKAIYWKALCIDVTPGVLIAAIRPRIVIPGDEAELVRLLTEVDDCRSAQLFEAMLE